MPPRWNWLAEADTVVFDKTGTLTNGAPTPLDLDGLPGDAARVALALAQGSSRGIRWPSAPAKALTGQGVRPAHVEGLREVPGHGVEGMWQGQVVRVGRAAWVWAEAPAETATFLKIGDSAPLTLRFADTLREGARMSWPRW